LLRTVPADDVIVLEDVYKHFPKTGNYRDIVTFWRRQKIEALRGVSLRVRRGSTFGLLGVNGAGKTTLLKVLAGLILVNKGRVVIGGEDVTREPERSGDHLIYITGDERTHYLRHTGRQNLDFYAELFEVPPKQKRKRIDEVLAITGITEAADEMSGKYSTGMKQRLAIARGLLSSASILLLDEPTRSLDPLGSRQIWEFIKTELIARQGKSVIIATHNMEEATYLCDTVSVIHRGQIRVTGPIQTLVESMSGSNRCTIELAVMPAQAVGAIVHMEGVREVKVLPRNGHEAEGLLQLTLDHPDQNLPDVIERLIRAGGAVTEVRRERPSLGDVVASMAGEKA